MNEEGRQEASEQLPFPSSIHLTYPAVLLPFTLVEVGHAPVDKHADCLEVESVYDLVSATGLPAAERNLRVGPRARRHWIAGRAGASDSEMSRTYASCLATTAKPRSGAAQRRCTPPATARH